MNLKKLQYRIEDWFYNVKDDISYIKEIGFRMWIFRKFIKYWDVGKIQKAFVNKEFEIIGEPVPDKRYKDWYSFLCKEKIDGWYSHYKFTNPDQEYELMKYFYKIMKLHCRYDYFPSDTLIFHDWVYIALNAGFSVRDAKTDEWIRRTKNIEDLDHHKAVWWKLLAFFFPYCKNDPEFNYEKQK